MILFGNSNYDTIGTKKRISALLSKWMLSSNMDMNIWVLPADWLSLLLQIDAGLQLRVLLTLNSEQPQLDLPGQARQKVPKIWQRVLECSVWYSTVQNKSPMWWWEDCFLDYLKLEHGLVSMNSTVSTLKCYQSSLSSLWPYEERFLTTEKRSRSSSKTTSSL